MKKSLTILILTALAATSFASKVTNVQLAYENGESVARIEVSGQIRFTHQTEIPKDGKPDRVIVDVLSATHELGAKVFDNLPNCPVTAIRTSQYSVKPEAVVRLVFDVKKTPVYQVETKGQAIVVHFVDKSATPFPTWSSTPSTVAPAKPAVPVAVAPKTESPKPNPATVAEKNVSAESDRQTSLATAPAKVVPVTPNVAPATQKPVATATPSTPTKTESPVVSPATKSPAVSITTTDASPAKPAITAPTVAATPNTNVKPAEQKPAANPVVAVSPTVSPAAPKTESKPVESKPLVSAPAPSSVSPAVKPSVEPGVKPAEQKPVTPIAPATTPFVTAKPTVPTTASAQTSPSTPVVKAEAKPVEQKSAPATVAPASKSVVATTEPATTGVKPVEQKPSSVSTPATTPSSPLVKVDAKPIESKPATPITGSTEPAKVSPVTPLVQSPVVNPATAKPGTVASSTPNTPAQTPAKPATVVAESSAKPAPTTSAPAPVVKPSTPAVSSVTPPTTNPSPTPAVKPAVTTPLAEAKTETSKPSPVAPKTDNSVKTPAVNPNAYTTEDTDIPSPEDLEPAQDNPYVDHDAPAGSQWTDQTPVDSNSTARFRRHPLSAAKIKGTLIAQFPQRLVIKYQSNGSRDPFATLIDDSKTYNSPTQQSIPNVDGLRLVGVIVARQNGNRALFIDKAGYSYMLQSGDKVRNGYVLRIESDRAYFQIFEYGWSRTVALKIDES